MKMRQITIEVDIHGTADYMDDHDITGKNVADAITQLLDDMEGVVHATVTVKKEQEYSV